jgi:hypothetical protein
MYLLCSIHLAAQVAVSKERRHHLVFENDKVRILNVLLPPGDTTQYHLHSTPSVFISFTKTLTVSQRINEQPESGTSAAGNLLFEDLSAPHTKVHRVWNMDTSVFHVMDVELLGKDSGFTLKPLSIPHMHLVTDTTLVRAYLIQLAKNEQVSIKDQPSGFILVALNDAKIKSVQNGKEGTSFIKPGQFYWINAQETFSILQLSNAATGFALLCIK